MSSTISTKIKIEGEKEYKSAISNINQQTKTLDAQLKAVSKSMDSETEGMKKSEKQTELLSKKKENLENQLKQMRDYLERVTEAYGENSTQALKVEEQMAKVEAQLADTNNQLTEIANSSETSNSAFENLSNTIEEQTAQLDELRSQYMDAVLQFGEGSDEANELATQIQDLNSELSDNQAMLDAAASAAANLTSANTDAANSADELSESANSAASATEGIGAAADTALATFSPAMAGIVTAASGADLIGALGGVVSAIGDIGTEVINLMDSWDLATAAISIGTSATGAELDELRDKAHDMWMAINDKDTSEEDVAKGIAAINTRFGEAISASDEAIFAFQKFSEITGTDMATAVNDTADLMKKWGLANGDTIETISNMETVLGMLSKSQANANISTGEMSSLLTNQSLAFQELDMNLEDAIGFIDAYVDAGGSSSEITTGMYQAMKNLSDVTTDVPAAWQAVTEQLNSNKSVSEKLNGEIEGLGISLEDVFGTRKAQQIIGTFSSSTVDIDKFTNSVKDSKTTMTEMYDNSRLASDNLTKFSKAFSDAGYQMGKSMESVSSASELTAIGASTLFKDIGEGINDLLGLNQDLDDNVNEIYPNLIAVAEDSVDGMREAFDTTIDAPKIRVPYIYYTTGSDGKSMIPHATYETYSKAYDRAMLLNSPTIFGAMNGKYLVGGDRAGTEVVVGESHLLSMIQKAILNIPKGNSVSNSNTYIIDGLTYSNGDELHKAMQNIVRTARIERRA